MKLPVELIPVWVIFLYICFLLVKRRKDRESKKYLYETEHS
jgi:aromatic amino acid transport protein AroP